MGASNRRPFWHWLVAAIVIVGIVVALWASLPVAEWIKSAAAYFLRLGAFAIPVFIVVYVVLASIAFPTTLLNIAAGIIFSYPMAFFAAMVGATGSAVLTFFIARYLATDWVRRRLERNRRAHAAMEAVKDGGFEMVLLSRLNPFIPGFVKGYGFGMTPVKFSIYLIATVLGQAPVVGAHVYLGWAGGTAMLRGEAPDAMHSAMLIGGVIVSVLLLAVVAWYGNRRMKRTVAAGQAHA